MNVASNFTATRTADRTTRTSVATIRVQDNTTGQPKTASASIRQTVRRLMNALMQSFATPHI
jgi:hypothetical protein